MENNIAVVEWSPDAFRAYNPATRQTSTGASIEEALHRVGSPGSVGLCMGRRASFVRETRTPNVDRADLRTIVGVQMEALFSAVHAELAFDFVTGAKTFDDGVQTTVAAVQAESLRKALSDVHSAGARVAWTAPTALGAAAVAHAQGHDDAIVVELVDGELNLDVVRYGMLVYSRTAIDPGNLEGRQGEVQRTLAAYGIPSAVVIAVEGTALGNDVRHSADGPLQAMSHHSPAALNIELPEVVVGKARRASQGKFRFAAVLWLAALIYGGYVYYSRSGAAQALTASVNKAARERQDVQKKIDALVAEKSAADANFKKIQQALAPSQPISDVLTLIVNSVPKDAWINGITFERAKPIQIRGTALTSDAVTQYTAALAMNDRLRDVQLQFANNSDIEKTPVVQFAVTAHVIGNLPLIEDSKRGAKK